MTNETMVTIQGWVGSDPTLRIVGGAPVLNFRVGATPRRYKPRTGEWVDGQTQWYTVSAWRHLAENGERSLDKGDPVLVHGRLEHRRYINNQGVEVVALEIEAVTLGHDMTRGSSRFRKVTRVVEKAREVPEPPDFGGSVTSPPEDPWPQEPATGGPADDTADGPVDATVDGAAGETPEDGSRSAA